ncbi:MAG: hypothetical protein QOG34_1294 [Frankiaceae bacterium]|nr:hypothetical protein [Frankiaceae bacterium]
MPRGERRTDVFEPDYAMVAYVHDGRFTAVAAVLAVLHARGLVVAGKSGTVRHSDSVTPPPEGFERQVWRSIHGFVSPGALMARPAVDAALNDLRRRARRLGLLRPLVPVRGFFPARTRLGRKLVAGALADYPWPLSPEHGEQPVELGVGMAVALHGDVALNALMPEFARDSGLLTREGAGGLDWADPEAPGPPAVGSSNHGPAATSSPTSGPRRQRTRGRSRMMRTPARARTCLPRPSRTVPCLSC